MRNSKVDLVPRAATIVKNAESEILLNKDSASGQSQTFDGARILKDHRITPNQL